jgi:hypothetical protein
MPSSPPPTPDKRCGLAWYNILAGWVLLIGGSAMLLATSWIAFAPDEISWTSSPSVPSCAFLALTAMISGVALVRCSSRNS